MDAKTYISMLPGNDAFNALIDADKDKWIFQATETLNDHIPPRKIDYKNIAIQTVYMFNGESEDITLLREQGIKTYTTEGSSITLESGPIAPAIISKLNGSGIGGLV